MPVVKMTLGLLFLWASFSGRGAPLYVVSLHQLTVVSLPLRPLSLPLPSLPVKRGPGGDAEVSGLITGQRLI